MNAPHLAVSRRCFGTLEKRYLSGQPPSLLLATAFQTRFEPLAAVQREG